jgi:hypothetical protein
MRTILARILASTLLATMGACSRPSDSKESTSSSRPVRNIDMSGSIANACIRDLKASDLKDIFSAPVAKMRTVSTNPEACTFISTNSATVTVGLRAGDEVQPFLKMDLDPANGRKIPLPGVGESAWQTPGGTGVVAVKGNYLCQVSVIGTESARMMNDITRSRGAELATKLGALCNKIFAMRS